MARPLRIEFPGALYHVTSRGNRRSDIFEDDHDRRSLLAVLEVTVSRFRWLCHAHCLMRNHYHLLIETPDGNLARGMRHLNGVYTQRYNRRHGNVGHLFQGRYKAILVEQDSHLLELCRYLALNPVRAKLVKHPRQWPWSSYRATAEGKKPPLFLHTDWVLRQFGRRRTEAQKSYRNFVKRGIGAPSPWEGLESKSILGSEGFVARCLARLNKHEELAEIPRMQKLAARPSLEKLFKGVAASNKSKRDEIVASAYREYGYRMKEIADFLGVHYATVSRAVVRFERMS